MENENDIWDSINDIIVKNIDTFKDKEYAKSYIKEKEKNEDTELSLWWSSIIILILVVLLFVVAFLVFSPKYLHSTQPLL